MHAYFHVDLHHANAVKKTITLEFYQILFYQTLSVVVHHNF